MSSKSIVLNLSYTVSKLVRFFRNTVYGHNGPHISLLVPVLLYGSECRCLKREDERRILTAEMTWLRRLLRVARRDKMRNETVRSILCQETTLVDRIAQPRLNWFGHVSRMGSQQKHYTAAISMGKETKEDNRRNGWTM